LIKRKGGFGLNRPLIVEVISGAACDLGEGPLRSISGTSEVVKKKKRSFVFYIPISHIIY
jgi:hypothetical protein